MLKTTATSIATVPLTSKNLNLDPLNKAHKRKTFHKRKLH